jgi:hypothetical protein
MKPIPVPRPLYTYDPYFLPFRIVDLVFERRRRVIRHG